MGRAAALFYDEAAVKSFYFFVSRKRVVLVGAQKEKKIDGTGNQGRGRSGGRLTARRTSKEMDRDTFVRRLQTECFDVLGRCIFPRDGLFVLGVFCLNLLFKSCPLLLFSHSPSCAPTSETMREHWSRNKNRNISRSLGAELALYCRLLAGFLKPANCGGKLSKWAVISSHCDLTQILASNSLALCQEGRATYKN